jgi:hypothetical protein
MQGRAGSIEKERYERIYAKPGRTWRRVITKVGEAKVQLARTPTLSVCLCLSLCDA